MPFIETVAELAESIADLLGVYECGLPDCECQDEMGGDHSDACRCRMCFVSEIRSRIMKAVAYDVGVDSLST